MDWGIFSDSAFHRVSRCLDRPHTWYTYVYIPYLVPCRISCTYVQRFMVHSQKGIHGLGDFLCNLAGNSRTRKPHRPPCGLHLESKCTKSCESSLKTEPLSTDHFGHRLGDFLSNWAGTAGRDTWDTLPWTGGFPGTLGPAGSLPGFTDRGVSWLPWAWLGASHIPWTGGFPDHHFANNFSASECIALIFCMHVDDPCT